MFDLFDCTHIIGFYWMWHQCLNVALRRHWSASKARKFCRILHRSTLLTKLHGGIPCYHMHISGWFDGTAKPSSDFSEYNAATRSKLGGHKTNGSCTWFAPRAIGAPIYSNAGGPAERERERVSRLGFRPPGASSLLNVIENFLCAQYVSSCS